MVVLTCVAASTIVEEQMRLQWKPKLQFPPNERGNYHRGCDILCSGGSQHAISLKYLNLLWRMLCRGT